LKFERQDYSAFLLKTIQSSGVILIMLKRPILVAITGYALTSGMLFADNTMETMVIIGTSEDARTLPGSGAVIDTEQLEIEVARDINQVMKTVPGVYVREEDGSGLRPNIGVRGATSERSANITLMEDGILMAPAPYADPAAYYFPTAMRMSSVEVLKGAPLLRYGPQTTGGAVNMVSTPIHESNRGSVTLGFGSHGAQDLHAHYGARHGQWSWLVETVKRNSDGFKDIDRSNRDSGFDIEDYVIKLGWESAQGPKQRVLFKAQHSTETSDETYLGLTDADFAANQDRRYGLSSIDQMDNKHTGISLVYSLALNDITTATATVYRNDFERDWFKLNGGGALIDAANAGNATAQGILDGTVDTTGLRYKHNSREYYSQGLELNFDVALGAHLLQVGGRIHEDEVDRFQPIEDYDQINGSLVFQSIIQPGSSDNRVGSAEANTLWMQDNWQVTDQLNAVLSLRYEEVESKEIRYSALNRSVIDRSTESDVSEWLPGASFTYDLNDTWQLLAGVHKGFSPLGAGGAPNEDPETSINWEYGARYRSGDLFIEAIGFYSDFSNKVENCSVGTPCSNGATSGTFKTGAAVISGLETQVGTQFVNGAFTFPVALAYTYTKAEISKDNVVSGLQDGDLLKDVPQNTFSARFGAEHNSGWNNYLVAKYIDEMCVAAGCNRNVGPQASTDSLLVMDYISRYRLNKSAEVFFKAENLLDEQEIISRDPDGARPNKPLSVTVGLQLDF
jgi:Fe(3+) dicitrate transport protein